MSTRRRERPGPRADALVTLGVVAVCIVAGLLSLQARSGLPGVARYTVTAPFADLANLKDHDDVRVAGVRVGQVLHARRDGGRAVVDLALAGDLRLTTGTRAVVRSRGLLGARYLELRPGTSGATVPDGGALALERTAAGRDLTDVLATFDPDTRADLQALLRGAGRGLSARGGDLGDLLSTAPRFTRDLGRMAAAITARPGAAARLLPSLRATTSALAPVARPFARTLAAQGDAALPFAQSADEVAATLRVAPGALAATRRSLERSAPLLAEARALAATARRSLARAPAGLRATTVLLAGTRRPLARTASLLEEAGRAAAPVRSLVGALPSTLAMLDDTVRHGTPLARKVATIQCDIHAFGTGWARMLGIALKGDKGDPELGPLTSLRLTVTPTPDTLHPAVTLATGDRLVGSNPYPAPCEAGEERLG